MIGYVLASALVTALASRPGTGRTGEEVAEPAHPRQEAFQAAVPTDSSAAATKPTSRPSRPPLSNEQIEAARKAGVKPLIEIDLGKGVTMTMVLIPAGTFMMGSPANEPHRKKNETQHGVTLTKPFYMAMTEVSQAQWQALMGTRPWKGKKHAKSSPAHAADYLSWNDCQEFLRKVNAKASGGGFRLPTEAEWEYACRAGSTTRFHNGDDPDNSQFGRYAWYDGNADQKGEKYPHAVGTKQSNGYGLHDMHGNVWEWCQDWHGDYPRGRATDPTGPGTGTLRVLRGGSWRDLPRLCRSAFRGGNPPSGRYSSLGFRCVRTVVIP